MKLKEIAHARTGDKGEISNISVIPYDENNYEMLKEKVTETRVAEYFSAGKDFHGKNNPLYTCFCCFFLSHFIYYLFSSYGITEKYWRTSSPLSACSCMCNLF